VTIVFRPLADCGLPTTSDLVPPLPLPLAVPRLAPPPSPPPSSLGLEAERRLRGSGYLALRDVVCEAQAGIVRLRGRLASYYLKQVAQALVADIDGVRGVVNLIEITAPPRPLRQWGTNSLEGGASPLGVPGHLSQVT